MERILNQIKLDLLIKPDIYRSYDSFFISKNTLDFAPRLNLLDVTGVIIVTYLISSKERREIEGMVREGFEILIQDVITNFWREQNIDKILNGY